MLAHELIAADIQKATRTSRLISPIIIVFGLALGLFGVFGLSGRTDDLAIIVAGLGVFASVVGFIVLLMSFRSIENNLLVQTLRDQPETITKLQLVKVLRNGVYSGTRVEVHRNNGRPIVYQHPQARAEAWANAIITDHPRLA